MDKISRNIFLVPLGNLLNDHLRLINAASGEKPAGRLWDEPPDVNIHQLSWVANVPGMEQMTAFGGYLIYLR